MFSSSEYRLSVISTLFLHSEGPCDVTRLLKRGETQADQKNRQELTQRTTETDDYETHHRREQKTAGSQ